MDRIRFPRPADVEQEATGSAGPPTTVWYHRRTALETGLGRARR